jgi:hypothetical protein
MYAKDYLTREVQMNLTVVLMLAIVVKTLVEYLTKPIHKLLSTPKEQRDGVFYLSLVTPYISFGAGLALGLSAKVDLFLQYIPDAITGLSLFLTACLIGGGAQIIYDVIKSLKDIVEKIGQITPIKILPPVIGDQ